MMIRLSFRTSNTTTSGVNLTAFPGTRKQKPPPVMRFFHNEGKKA
jgi:hypothetical protein